MYVLHAFYDMDVLEEDAILEWAQALQSSEGPEKRFVQQVTNEICAVMPLSFLFPTQSQKFLTWLKDAEEDDDDSSEEEEL